MVLSLGEEGVLEFQAFNKNPSQVNFFQNKQNKKETENNYYRILLPQGTIGVSRIKLFALFVKSKILKQISLGKIQPKH